MVLFGNLKVRELVFLERGHLDAVIRQIEVIEQHSNLWAPRIVIILKKLNVVRRPISQSGGWGSRSRWRWSGICLFSPGIGERGNALWTLSGKVTSLEYKGLVPLVLTKAALGYTQSFWKNQHHNIESSLAMATLNAQAVISLRLHVLIRRTCHWLVSVNAWS